MALTTNQSKKGNASSARRRVSVQGALVRAALSSQSTVSQERVVPHGVHDEKEYKKVSSWSDWIRVFGAREHNLKNVNVAIPKGTLTVITGPSGSGKSSLALDVLFTEGKRRYMESLSSYARQFLGIAKKPEVDRIDGLCPSIAIEQKTVGSNPRSTVGTITEIYDYLRLLFARIGVPYCPTCNIAIKPVSSDVIIKTVREQYAGMTVTVTAPLVTEKKGEFTGDILSLFDRGHYRFRIDGQSYKFKAIDEIKALKLAKTYRHTIDVVIDTVEVGETDHARLAEAIEAAFIVGAGAVKLIVGNREHFYSSRRSCPSCAQSFPELEPRFFSFNSPIGACKSCNGLGVIHEWPWDKNDPEFWKSNYPDFFGKYAQELTCATCAGKRLHALALAVRIADKNIMEIGDLSLRDALLFFKELHLTDSDREIAISILNEILNRLSFLNEVGLSYLSLNRSSRTLSGGEGQRIRLATQIGSALSGVLYVLDEPSIGLHQRDNDRLIKTLKALRDQGNTVVVVEHDLDTIMAADYLVDMGPAAGIHGGRVTAVGTPAELAKNNHSLTGSYIAGIAGIPVPAKVRTPRGFMTLRHANKNNLKNIDVQFPLGVLCGISGVSGSGKSTLIMEELVPELDRLLNRRGKPSSSVQEQSDLTGYESLLSLVVIDQSPIGRTPRSNPATYLGIFDDIRRLFASLPESNARGYTVGRFSFNVDKGRCRECSGDGVVTVSMQFLADVTVVCKSCNGQRYNRETLEITYRGKNIAQVLEMSAIEAVEFFAAHAPLKKRLQLLCDVGLDYLKLGQPSTTLSGGEAQRIKLVDELAKRGNNTLYILDEPTTGLHTHDIEKLLVVLNTLVDKGNSMLVIEHNLDVLKTVDYLIDLGPEGGDQGGTVVAAGTPAQVAAVAASHTGRYIKPLLKRRV